MKQINNNVNQKSKKIPDINQAQTHYQNASMQLVGWALQHPDKFKQLSIETSILHESVKPLAEAIYSTNGSDDVMSYLATHYMDYINLATKAMGNAPITQSGQQILSVLKECKAMLDIARAYADRDLTAIQNTINELNLIKDSHLSGIDTVIDSCPTWEHFLEANLPQRPYIIQALFRQGQIVLVYAKPGVGKTWLVLAWAIGATRQGKIFGPFETTNSTKAIYVDAEMNAAEMQSRCNSLDIQASPDSFKLISSELLATSGMKVPTLSEEWRYGIKKWLQDNPDYRLLVLDNLSSLTPGVDEQKRIEWDPINQWLLELRRMGVAVILVHHAGKGGDQRGSSAREDQIDISLRLTALEDRDLTAFRCDFHKGRSLSAEEKKPFVVELTEKPNGKLTFIHKAVSEDILAQVAFLVSNDWKQQDISKKLEVSQGTVSKKLNKALKDGLIVAEGSGQNKKYTLTELGQAHTMGMSDE